MFRQTGPRNFWRVLGLDVSLQYERPGHFCSPPAPSGHCRCLWHGLFAPCTETKQHRWFFARRLIREILLGPSPIPHWFAYLSTSRHMKKEADMECSDVILLNSHLSLATFPFDHILSFKEVKLFAVSRHRLNSSILTSTNPKYNIGVLKGQSTQKYVSTPLTSIVLYVHTMEVNGISKRLVTSILYGIIHQKFKFCQILQLSQKYYFWWYLMLSVLFVYQSIIMCLAIYL